MSEVAIFLCDITGVMAEPWIEAGYEAILVDPQHPTGVCVCGPVTTVGCVIDHRETWALLRKVLRDRRVAFVAGFPPCTDLAVSGARWFGEKATNDQAFQFKAMQVVWQCHVIGELSGAPWMVENPVSQISSFWRKPDHSFNPWQFTGYEPSDNYTKKTMLWTGGGFVMPRPEVDSSLGPPDNRIHTAPPSNDRANFRSATPRGFARAVYFSNGPL
jgi:hypothetical protein